MSKKSHEQRDYFQRCGYKETTKDSAVTQSSPSLGLKGQEREWLLETEGERILERSQTSNRGTQSTLESSLSDDQGINILTSLSSLPPISYQDPQWLTQTGSQLAGELLIYSTGQPPEMENRWDKKREQIQRGDQKIMGTVTFLVTP